MADQKPLIEQVIQGLMVFNKYPNSHIAARDDIIHAGIDNPELMALDEVKELLGLGWHQTQLGWAHWLT